VNASRQSVTLSRRGRLRFRNLSGDGDAVLHSLQVTVFRSSPAKTFTIPSFKYGSSAFGSSSFTRDHRNSCESCCCPSVNSFKVSYDLSAFMNLCGLYASTEECRSSLRWIARTTRANSFTTSEAFLSADLSSTRPASGGVCASACRHAAAKHVFPRFTSPRGACSGVSLRPSGAVPASLRAAALAAAATGFEATGGPKPAAVAGAAPGASGASGSARNMTSARLRGA
jgi:hypothetical protein